MTNVYYLFHRIDDTQDVGNLSYAAKPGTVSNQAFKQLDAEMSVFVYRKDFNDGFFPSGASMSSCVSSTSTVAPANPSTMPLCSLE